MEIYFPGQNMARAQMPPAPLVAKKGCCPKDKETDSKSNAYEQMSQYSTAFPSILCAHCVQGDESESGFRLIDGQSSSMLSCAWLLDTCQAPQESWPARRRTRRAFVVRLITQVAAYRNAHRIWVVDHIHDLLGRPPPEILDLE